MKLYSKTFGLLLASSVLIESATGAESIVVGKVKGIQADKHEFVLTDTQGKDKTIKLGDNFVINRGGKESQSDLKDNDAVCVYYEKSVLAWTATYILVQEGDTKNCSLAHGNVKNYDSEKREITYTDDQGKDSTYSTRDVKVLFNKKESKVENIKIGEHVLAILQMAGDKTTLKSLLVDRK